MQLHLNLKLITDVIVYWGFFWNAVYFLAPPREWFNSPKYNRFLEVVSYYGALNIRGLVMKFYQAQPQDAPLPPQPGAKAAGPPPAGPGPKAN